MIPRPSPGLVNESRSRREAGTFMVGQGSCQTGELELSYHPAQVISPLTATINLQQQLEIQN